MSTMVQRKIDQYFRHREPRSHPAKASPPTIPFSIRDLPLPQTIHLNYAPPSSLPCLFQYQTLEASEIPAEEILTNQSSALAHFLDTPPTPSIHLDRRCDCEEKQVEEGGESRWCGCTLAPYELLYISPKIEEEVRYRFWSEHTFTVCMSDIGGLDVLYALPGKAVQQITSLIIRLNVYECTNEMFRGHECNLYCHPGCRTRGHDNFISNARSGYFRPILRDWEKMCEFLAKCILPGRLKLAFVCDMDDIESAREILAPMNQLPLLKECALRLGVLPIGNTGVQSKLQNMATRTALQLTGRWIDRPFQFLDLPQEIQLRILSYTELVASRDLQHVSPGRVPHQVPGRNLVTFFEPAAFDGDNYSYQVTKCYHVMYAIKCCGRCFDVSGICLCRVRHAAFSTTCTCWRMPTAIFQVSQKVRNDAESVFYSRNHFLAPIDTSSSEVIPVLLFLQQIPARAIKYLQHVTSVNPFLCANMNSARGQWSEFFDTLVLEGNFSGFNLTLGLGYQARDNNYYKIMETLPPGKAIEKVFGRSLLAAKQLAALIKERGRLRNFFFHISNPLQREEQNACRRQREMEIERIVMGERYESVASGKYKRRHAWNGYTCEKDCSACLPSAEG
jgi:hypothetical protein